MHCIIILLSSAGGIIFWMLQFIRIKLNYKAIVNHYLQELYDSERRAQLIIYLKNLKFKISTFSLKMAIIIKI